MIDKINARESSRYHGANNQTDLLSSLLPRGISAIRPSGNLG